MRCRPCPATHPQRLMRCSAALGSWSLRVAFRVVFARTYESAPGVGLRRASMVRAVGRRCRGGVEGPAAGDELDDGLGRLAHRGPMIVYRVVATLRTALNAAVRTRQLVYNPALHAVIPPWWCPGAAGPPIWTAACGPRSKAATRSWRQHPSRHLEPRPLALSCSDDLTSPTGTMAVRHHPGADAGMSPPAPSGAGE